MAGKQGLTKQQEAFCHRYVASETLNATQAALEAGYAKGSAAVRAVELLKNDKVKARIAELNAERLERMNADKDDVRRRLSEKFEADLADIYRENGELKPVHEWPKVWRQGLVTGVDVQTMKGAEDDEHVVVKVKLADRLKVIDLLGKHSDVSAFKEVHEHRHEGLTDVLDGAMERAEQKAREYRDRIKGESK